ncbi:S-adenosyl-L-methionine-dependent methyltransferase [Xylogone sp. PMI_703]|nr:S-adenosyl-L-methionine-dependent methyltransferase [Xylogone sp. PMI_703]
MKDIYTIVFTSTERTPMLRIVNRFIPRIRAQLNAVIHTATSCAKMSSTTNKVNLDSLWNNPDIALLYKSAHKVTGPFAKTLVQQSGVTATHEQPLVLLDQGSGFGAVATALHDELGRTPEKEWRLTCTDVSEPMMERLRDKIKSEGWQNIDVTYADAQKSGLPSSNYNFVFASFVLMALPDSQAALDDCVRILKPGGTIAFTTWQKVGWIDTVNETIALLSDELPRVSWEKFQAGFQKGDWHDPSWLEVELKNRGLRDVNITTDSRHIEGLTPQEMGLGVMPPMKMIMALDWTEGQRQQYGEKFMPKMIEYLESRGSKEAPVWHFVANVVTARKPL